MMGSASKNRVARVSMPFLCLAYYLAQEIEDGLLVVPTAFRTAMHMILQLVEIDLPVAIKDTKRPGTLHAHKPDIHWCFPLLLNILPIWVILFSQNLSCNDSACSPTMNNSRFSENAFSLFRYDLQVTFQYQGIS